MISGNLPHDIGKLHNRYGEIVRVAPDELSIIHPAIWTDVYQKNFRRPRIWADKPPGAKGNSLISADAAEHARLRKILSPIFSDRSLREYEPTVSRYLDILVGKIRKAMDSHGCADINVLEWFNYTAFDTISDLGWGTSLNCLAEERYHPWMEVLFQFKAVLVAVSAKYFPPLDRFLDWITPPSALAGLRLVLNMNKERVENRLKMGPERKDMMTHILKHNATSTSSPMSREDIELNSMLIITGGSEPVTTVLVGTLNYLLDNPSALAKLNREVRDAFQSQEQVTANAVKGLPYLNAVLQEGMRMCPTIPDGMRREIPRGGAVVAGEALPEGVVVSFPQWAGYRSDLNFKSPSSFIPERWLQESTPGTFSGDRKEVFEPFSIGINNCIGQNFAWLFIRVFLATVVWNFDIHFAKGEKRIDWNEQKIHWFWDKKPLFVQFTNASQVLKSS